MTLGADGRVAVMMELADPPAVAVYAGRRTASALPPGSAAATTPAVQAHIARLHAGLPESIETSSIHLDALNDLKRINSHATNIAYVVLGEI